MNEDKWQPNRAELLHSLKTHTVVWPLRPGRVFLSLPIILSLITVLLENESIECDERYDTRMHPSRTLHGLRVPDHGTNSPWIRKQFLPRPAILRSVTRLGNVGNTPAQVYLPNLPSTLAFSMITKQMDLTYTAQDRTKHISFLYSVTFFIYILYIYVPTMKSLRNAKNQFDRKSSLREIYYKNEIARISLCSRTTNL